MFFLSLLTFLFSTLSGQSQTVDIETTFIGNSHFIEVEPWMPIDIDTVYGEDINSTRYGAIFRKVIRAKYPGYLKKTTIAKGEMDLDLVIHNRSKKAWQVKTIELRPLNSTRLARSVTNDIRWPYSTRSEEDDIRLKIKTLDSSILYVPRQILIKSQGQSDNKLSFNLSLANDFDHQNTILCFAIIVHLISSSSQEQLVLSSDKNYYIYVGR